MVRPLVLLEGGEEADLLDIPVLDCGLVKNLIVSHAV